MRLRQALHDKFPEAPDDDVLKVVGNLLFFRYMNPAIVAPDAFDIIDMGKEKRMLEAEQRRNLGAIAKVLQHAAAGKLVGSYLIIHISICVYVCLFVHSFVHPLIYMYLSIQSIHPLIHSFIHPSIYLPI